MATNNKMNALHLLITCKYFFLKCGEHHVQFTRTFFKNENQNNGHENAQTLTNRFALVFVRFRALRFENVILRLREF